MAEPVLAVMYKHFLAEQALVPPPAHWLLLFRSMGMLSAKTELSCSFGIFSIPLGPARAAHKKPFVVIDVITPDLPVSYTATMLQTQTA